MTESRNKNREYFYRKMKFIRSFETTLLEKVKLGLVNGTTHTYIGQEHIAVSYMEVIDVKKDIIFSNHRCHGHFISYCGETFALCCELMGRQGGTNHGIGGSQHIHYGNFFTNGIQGGIVANAAGAALTEKIKGSGAVTTVFMGDGTLGQGIVYETFNLAALWELPIIFLVENNQYAQSTSVQHTLRGSIADRFSAFGIRSAETNEIDPIDLVSFFGDVVNTVRETVRPMGVVVDTYRLGPHSKSDDFRDPVELEKYHQKDPLKKLRTMINDAENIDVQIDEEIKEIFSRAENMALADGACFEKTKKQDLGGR